MCFCLVTLVLLSRRSHTGWWNIAGVCRFVKLVFPLLQECILCGLRDCRTEIMQPFQLAVCVFAAQLCLSRDKCSKTLLVSDDLF
ncbi:hypothetical protein DW702_13490 [Bacteroides salyersiae]|nr:hypothetical protein DW702_13490 [Bacteroides salyersiae]RYT47535.1 hypothetical protein EAJ08_14255 [Bacteroides salyersiae]